MDDKAIDALLERVLAPWVKALGLKPLDVTEDSATLRLPFSGELRHAGGVICGQVFMAAADTAMIVAISAALGEFKPMTTVALNTNFMRGNLVFGEIELYDEDGRMAVHATSTYALLD
jgi:acyl-coenzyme A thioesterase PaaI-like protein